MDGDTGRCEGATAEKAVPFPDTVHRSERSQAKALARDNYNPERDAALVANGSVEDG